MNHTPRTALLYLTLAAAFGLAACQKADVAPPVVVVPGPAGAPGATGATGATGASGDAGKPAEGTTVVVKPAASSASSP